MLKSLIFIALCFTIGTSYGQSFFAPLPKLHGKYGGEFRSTTPLPDSTFTGFRPMISAAVYGYTKGGGSSVFTGAGISYEKDSWNVSTQKWYTDWSVAALAYAGGTFAPTDAKSVIALGAALSFFNKLASVGAAYNLETHTWMPTIGVSISLNN